MAELTTQERLQPALLDRLTDDEPGNRLESRDQRVIDLPKLRRCILRDLSWLLNTPHLASTLDLDGYPLVANSVVNYGVPSFAGMLTAKLTKGALEAAVRDSVVRFEPRLIEKSVKVRVIGIGRDTDTHNALQIEIEAELWAQPVPLRMFMKTELDLEIGTVRLTEKPAPSAARRR
jgi:type VI secretion system protein ImpF